MRNREQNEPKADLISEADTASALDAAGHDRLDERAKVLVLHSSLSAV